MKNTKRESLKTTKIKIENISKFGYISLGIGILALLFTLPIGETIFNYPMNIQLIASIVLVIIILFFLYWIWLLVYKFYLEKTMSLEIYVSGLVPFGGDWAEIKIENKEPVNLSEVYIELQRFSWTKTSWNDVDSLTSETSNNFFSNGLIEISRKVSRQPIFVKIAKRGGKNITEILLDNYSAYLPLNPTTIPLAFNHEYEFVFDITGKFDDDDKSISLGKYYGKLIHEQIQPHGDFIEQNIFKWEEFYKTSDEKEILKAMLNTPPMPKEDEK